MTPQYTAKIILNNGQLFKTDANNYYLHSLIRYRIHPLAVYIKSFQVFHAYLLPIKFYFSNCFSAC